MRYCHALNRRLAIAENLAGLRSELQTGRIRFAHFLAESAGLVETVNGRLAPSPRAWVWLAAPEAERFSHLWQSWQIDNANQHTLWRRFRLNGSITTGPSTPNFYPHLRHVLATLSACAPATPINLSMFIETLASQRPDLWSLTPWWEEEAGIEAARALVETWFAEPLSWWGILSADASPPHQLFRLTSPGWQLLQGTLDLPDTHGTPFLLSPDFTITASREVRPSTLVLLEAMADFIERDGQTLRYRLTSQSLGRALNRGLELEAALRLLNSESRDGLPAAWRQQIESWAQQRFTIRLAHTTLLESDDPQRLAAIVHHSQIRPYVLRTLSPRAVVIAETAAGRVAQTMEKLGLAAAPQIPRPASRPTPAGSLSAQEAARWLLAGQVYQALGRWIDLPQPLPAAILDIMAAQLDTATLATVEQTGVRPIGAGGVRVMPKLASLGVPLP
ncbi:MAG: hypothetical protein EXR62_09410 [Chloroflexi bacterium]|nr:hypothetical protein [Chloroflexota bacterium]